MPFSPHVAGVLLRSALGMYGDSRTRLRAAGRARDAVSEDGLYARLRRIPGVTELEGYSPQALRGVARRAVNAGREGERSQRFGDAVPRADRIPADPNLSRSEARYRTRVAVDYTATNGVRDRTVIEYDSDVLRSRNQIQADISQWTEIQSSPGRRDGGGAVLIQADSQTTVTVLSVVKAQ